MHSGEKPDTEQTSPWPQRPGRSTASGLPTAGAQLRAVSRSAEAKAARCSTRLKSLGIRLVIRLGIIKVGQ